MFPLLECLEDVEFLGPADLIQGLLLRTSKLMKGVEIL